MGLCYSNYMDQSEMENFILAIVERNKKVELDKGWETSLARRFFILVTTYFAALIWLKLINEPGAWLKSFVPLGGYIFSTLSLPWLKKIWTKYRVSQ